MSEPRFQVSVQFTLSLAHDGQAFLLHEASPHTPYWLEPEERMVFSVLGASSPGPMTPYGGLAREQLMAACLVIGGDTGNIDRRRKALETAFKQMLRLGVIAPCETLPDPRAERTALADMAQRLRHQPFPADLVRHIVRRGRVKADSRVLELPGGPADLAVQLTQTSRHVAVMQPQRRWLQTARRRAVASGRNLEMLQDSPGRLALHDGLYDLIAVTAPLTAPMSARGGVRQTAQGLDDIAFCQGVCRTLDVNGDLMVVHTAVSVTDSHPLAHLLGPGAIAGPATAQPFVDEVRSLARRLTGLFTALEDIPGLRSDLRTRPIDTAIYRQRRAIDLGFVRTHFTASHIAATGLSERAFWSEVEARLMAASDDQLRGAVDWAVLHFRRGFLAEAISMPEAAPAQRLPFKPGDVPAWMDAAGVDGGLEEHDFRFADAS